MADKKNYDVVIVGAGITGLSAALHLHAQGIRKILLVAPGPTKEAVSQGAAGYLCGGQIDNYTRITNAHGDEFAKTLWQFGDLAFDLTRKFCADHQIAVKSGRRLRLITSEPELQEAKQAVSMLQQAGFASRLLSRGDSGFASSVFGERVLAVQDDGDRSAYLDAGHLMKGLGKATMLDILPQRVTAIHPHKADVVVDVGAQKINCEMVVLANHLAIADLLPVMKSILISYADQWVPVDWQDESSLNRNLAGSFITANHTHEWGVFTDTGTLNFGGGRYLRKHAGIEAAVATYEQKIEEHLIQQVQKTIKNVIAPEVGAGRALLECRPCDELPVIGPMFGETRVLLACGYMGQGLSMGFLAGRCLAEIVAKGTSATLPQRLLPRRLRSMPES